MRHFLKGWAAALVLVASCSPVPAMTIKGDMFACQVFADTMMRTVEYRNRNNASSVWTWEQAEPYLMQSLKKARAAGNTWIKDDEDEAYVRASMQMAYHSFGEPGSVAAVYFKGCLGK